MSQSSRPPRFKPFQAPTAIAVQKINKAGNYRGSPRERGYDSKWDRLSIAYRKRHTCCLFCEQRNRDTLTDLVDHILPVVDRPDLKYEWSNLAALCRHCHGIKAQLEKAARDAGNLDLLVEWVKNPLSRPFGLRPMV
ncbi:HNH endonuclease signature motif containing protein [Mesorhizobium sp. M0189]|uniref:HNH endonuclease n=1 Tax=Mesorhizobium sp. M0189 TaxID=2956909 RepID=UPI003337CA35